VAAEGTPGFRGGAAGGSASVPSDPLADYDFELPPELVAQHPAPERDGARLLVLDRGRQAIEHARVRDLPRRLRPGDLLVLNASRVLPARLRGRKRSGGAVQALLLRELGPGSGRFAALLRAPGRLRGGLELRFVGAGRALEARVEALHPDGAVVLAFPPGSRPLELGEAPLPPYIRRPEPDPRDLERYQTVYAREPGSVAAPTAGLHLSERLLEELASAGVERTQLVLHVGPGTFRPPGPAELASGRLHAETLDLPPACARAVAEARRRGGRVVAVGTTVARALESRAEPGGDLRVGRGETDLFLRPGWRFRAVDALLTNFHLPRSSLLLLVAAFAGRERVLRAYAEAIAAGYRFYSYGDAMLVL
jgi:S-adenosylmethionine:tRNA ribosyltransferase-isomerase